jgi:hypothetical protein
MNAGMNGLNEHETKMMYKCQPFGRGTARELDRYAPPLPTGQRPACPTRAPRRRRLAGVPR